MLPIKFIDFNKQFEDEIFGRPPRPTFISCTLCKEFIHTQDGTVNLQGRYKAFCEELTMSSFHLYDEANCNCRPIGVFISKPTRFSDPIPCVIFTSKDSDYVKSVNHNLNISRYRHAYNCRPFYDLSA